MPNPLNLLILTSRANEAEALVTALRNGGLAARGMYTQHPQRLAELTANHPCDLILCCVYDAKIDLDATLLHHRALSRDLPLILIADGQTPPDTLLQAMRGGARNLTERNDPGHLQWVVAREWADLQLRRELIQVRAQLERCEQRTRDLVEASGDASACIQQGIHVQSNQAYRTLLGFAQAEDLDGFPIMDLIAPEGQAEAKAFLRDCETGDGRPKSKTLTCVGPDGNPIEVEVGVTRTEIDDEPCLRLKVQPKGLAGSGGEHPGRDADTGLPCRGALLQELGRRLDAPGAGPLALVLARVTGLERVAQNEGLCAAFDHAATVGTLLRDAVPEGGFLARVGDDAFALVLQPADADAAKAIAELVRQRARHPGNGHDEAEPATGCVTGLALAGPDDREAKALLDRAFHDSEPRPVRHPAPGGRHQPPLTREPVIEPVVPTAPPPAERPPEPIPELILERLPEPRPESRPEPTPAPALAAAPAPVVPQPAAPRPPKAPTLRIGEPAAPPPDPALMATLVDQALRGTGPAELRLVYQPIVSLMGDSQENYSVLVRLLDADQNLHEAKAFLGAATNAGRMGDIDRWVVQHAIAELASQRANGHRLNFFVNIAEGTLQDEELIVWICDQLRDFDARGGWLTFQFPEEEARRNLVALTRLVEGLKKIKCRIALTRCGQLDNPQMLMQSLPLDFLLFAHDFANGLAEDKVKQQQLISFANLAHEFNVKSIVTGVEDARALTVLWTAGIDYVQGNFLQRPSPSLEIQG